MPSHAEWTIHCALHVLMKYLFNLHTEKLYVSELLTNIKLYCGEFCIGIQIYGYTLKIYMALKKLVPIVDVLRL